MTRTIQRLLLPFVLLFAAGGATAADEPVTRYLRADIAIEADGTLSRLDWHDGGKIPSALRERLDERVRAWTFVPGMVDGQPARTQSTLRLNVRLDPRDDGFAVHVVEASTGARMVDAVPPDYPFEALRRGAEAAVLAELHVAADGSRDVVIANYAGDKRHRAKFEKAVRGALADVQVTLEEVGGRPAPATLRVPFEFCMTDATLKPCDPHAWPELEGAPAVATAPRGEAVPAGSVASITTDVSGAPI